MINKFALFIDLKCASKENVKAELAKSDNYINVLTRRQSDKASLECFNTWIFFRAEMQVIRKYKTGIEAVKDL